MARDPDSTPDPEQLPPTGSFADAGESSIELDFELDEPATKIGRYEIVKRLGSGGFGFVYLALDPDLHRKVAVKVPRWDRPLTDKAIRLFLQEGKMLAQANHPSIVSVHDVGTTEDGIPFVVMEFVEGENLSFLIKNDTLQLNEILEILTKIAEALQQAHKKGLVHRDFKPANVIVDDEGQIHLVDFGLALHDEISVDEWESKQIAGTPNYMAPEQVRGENHLIDGQTDIWAFGVTMYRLLVGRMPFRAKGHRNLVRSICYKNPKPLRQLNPEVPRQLERICLRCLQKLMEDRYQSMADVIEELEAYKQDTVAETEPAHDLTDSPSVVGLARLDSKTNSNSDNAPNTLREKESDMSGPGSASSPSKSQPTGGSQTNTANSGSTSLSMALTIIPKGLRSFDKNDQEFFLQLLPGPTDRLGTPESIRFWHSRLGVVDQVDDIPVGVIYGPSGSGKSSFVRAGLLPRLPSSVIDIYIDCTTDNLEDHIASQLHRQFENIPSNQSLGRILRQIRNGEHLRRGDKLLLVLDQFEQWLSATSDLEQQELTEALRQCDSERIQALLLIRDEFWLSASQFMKCLGQRIEEKRNAMPLPLFDKRHAGKVLESIGRAYKSLPPEGQALTKPQKSFIREAVESLAERDRVICVHLTVFAETIKNSEWNLNQLRAKGGWDGIGRDYVSGIFNNPETPAFIKRHSREAWGILKQLLPPTTTELKGVSMEREALYARTAIPMSRNCFDQLMEYLELDCNLISRIENEDDIDTSGEPSPAGQSAAPLYGLTHDFLVNPIREWGNAKQNETISGRATSDLTHLAKQWEITKDRRFLPSLWDYGRFALFADKNVTGSIKEYWSTAGRRSLFVLSLQVAACAVLLVISLSLIRSRQNSALQRALVCDSVDFADAVVELQSSLNRMQSELKEYSSHPNPNIRFRARCLTLISDPSDQEAAKQLCSELELVDVQEFATLKTTSLNRPAHLIGMWRQNFNRIFENAKSLISPPNSTVGDLQFLEPKLRRCSRLATLLLALGSQQELANMMEATQNPIHRSIAILEIPIWHGRVHELFSQLDPLASDDQNANLISGLASGIGLYAKEGYDNSDDEGVIDWLQECYQKNDHGGVHFAALYALRQLKRPVPFVATNGKPSCQWKHFSIELGPNKKLDLPFVRIRPGKYLMGDGYSRFEEERKQIGVNVFPKLHTMEIERPFWISATLLSKEDFKAILESTGDEFPFVVDNIRKVDWKKASTAPTVCRNANYLSALMAANTIGSKTGHEIRYQIDRQAPTEFESNPKSKIHLPTEAQLELATRSFSRTTFYTGNHSEIADRLIGKSKETAVFGFPPNAFGIFDGSRFLEWLDHYIEKDGDFLGLLKNGNESPSPTAQTVMLPHHFIYGSIRFVMED